MARKSRSRRRQCVRSAASSDISHGETNGISFGAHATPARNPLFPFTMTMHPFSFTVMTVGGETVGMRCISEEMLIFQNRFLHNCEKSARLYRVMLFTSIMPSTAITVTILLTSRIVISVHASVTTLRTAIIQNGFSVREISVIATSSSIVNCVTNLCTPIIAITASAPFVLRNAVTVHFSMIASDVAIASSAGICGTNASIFRTLHTPKKNIGGA